MVQGLLGGDDKEAVKGLLDYKKHSLMDASKGMSKEKSK
jgi:hypothetical protein